VEEPVHHLLDDACLDLIVEGIQRQVCGRAHDMECGIEVKCAIRESKSPSVNEAKCEMKRSRSERRRR